MKNFEELSAQSLLSKFYLPIRHKSDLSSLYGPLTRIGFSAVVVLALSSLCPMRIVKVKFFYSKLSY
jgi:hypothetical protein